MPLQHGELPRISRPAQGAVQQRAQHRPFHRFFDIPESSGFDGCNRALFAPFAGDDDGRNVKQFLAKLLQQVQPVHAGQFDVRYERVRLVAREFRQRIFRRAHAQHVAAPSLQELFIALPRVIFVFHNQDAVFSLRRFDGTHRRPCLFPHGSQPLFGFRLLKWLVH